MLTPKEQYREFESALAHFIQDEMPWPYTDVDRHSDEANDVAWAIARAEGPMLWTRMSADHRGSR
jgi:hypothetical protein